MSIRKEEGPECGGSGKEISSENLSGPIEELDIQHGIFQGCHLGKRHMETGPLTWNP